MIIVPTDLNVTRLMMLKYVFEIKRLNDAKTRFLSSKTNLTCECSLDEFRNILSTITIDRSARFFACSKNWN